MVQSARVSGAAAGSGTGKRRTDTCQTSAGHPHLLLQMFAPLLEGGEARDVTVFLRDSTRTYRRYALRIGMLMADIPEICRQLGI